MSESSNVSVRSNNDPGVKRMQANTSVYFTKITMITIT